MKKTAYDYAKEIGFGEIEYFKPGKDEEGVLLVELFRVDFLMYRKEVIQKIGQKKYIELALEIIPKIPQVYFDRVEEPLTQPIINKVLLSVEGKAFDKDSFFHKIIDAVMDRTNSPSACEAEDPECSALVEAVKYGARPHVIKKLVGLSNATFKRYYRDMLDKLADPLGRNIRWMERGPLHKAEVWMLGERSAEHVLYARDAYTDEEVVQIRGWIQDRLDYLRDRAINPVSSRVKSAYRFLAGGSAKKEPGITSGSKPVSARQLSTGSNGPVHTQKGSSAPVSLTASA